MDWNSAVRASWKIFALLILPLLILGIVLIIHGSGKTGGTSGGHVRSGQQVGAAAGDQESSRRLWPNATVPYVIDPQLVSAELLIRSAFKQIHEKTCVRFVQKEAGHGSWVTFTRNDEVCLTSDVGRRGRGQGQEVQFGIDCLTAANVQRALGLLLGLPYEETRPDREKFVRYNPLRKECIERLEKYDDDEAGGVNSTKTVGISDKHSAAALGIVFDYASHMFVTRECFTPLRSSPIKLGSSDDGESGHFSVLDLEKLNAMYGCPGCNSYRFMNIHQILATPHGLQHFNPVESGHDIDQEPVYVCRAYRNGALLIGKLKVSHDHASCWTAEGSSEFHYSHNFEVLTNPSGYNFTWGPLDVISAKALVGGRTNERETVYIGKCKISRADSAMSGSYLPRIGSLYVPFGGDAVKCPSFQLLTC